MVERPIKKSERLANAAAGDTDSATQEPVVAQPSERDGQRPEHRKPGKGKGKGGSRKDDAPKQGVNPALMRGPKPAKPKPVMEEVTSETEMEAGEPSVENAEELAAEVS
jgi:hypothetical protein